MYSQRPSITIQSSTMSPTNSSDLVQLNNLIAQYSASTARMQQLQRRSLTRIRQKALEYLFVQICSLTEQTQKLSLVIKAQLNSTQNQALIEEFRHIVQHHHQSQVFFYQEYRLYESNKAPHILQNSRTINDVTSLLRELEEMDPYESSDEDAMALSYISFEPFNEPPPPRVLSRVVCGALLLIGVFGVLLWGIGHPSVKLYASRLWH